MGEATQPALILFTKPFIWHACLPVYRVADLVNLPNILVGPPSLFPSPPNWERKEWGITPKKVRKGVQMALDLCL